MNYTLAFALSPLGPKRFQKILNTFDSLEDAWRGSQQEYQDIGIVGLTYKKFDEFRKRFDLTEYESKLQRAKVVFVPFTEKSYPKKLKKLENPPIGLFAKGNLELLKSSVLIASVGTRKVTEYGRTVTESIVSELARNGLCIVSGLALGIDGISHRVTLENKEATIAVLACGVDCCTPAENYSLYKKILDNGGLVISEYPLSQPPNKGTFLARNRIVAALSDGILVAEAAEDSGSLVTAGWGFALEKKVFAVPGPINSQMSRGSLKLLKQGAVLVTEAEDILQEFKIKKSKGKIANQKLKNLSHDEKKIISFIENEGLTIDELSRASRLSMTKLFGLISNLELKGIIKNSGGIMRLVV